jgi:hypothetical protein
VTTPRSHRETCGCSTRAIGPPALEREREAFSERWAGPDHRAALHAFVTRRK